jgi:hypothetical protein
MKYVRSMALAALGLGVLGTSVAIGCGGSTVSENEGGAGTKGSGGAAGTKGGGGSPNIDAGPGIIPPEAGGSMTTQSTPQNFALHQLYLGDTDYGGSAGGDPNAWQKMGYNIDGKITTATSTNVCKLVNSGGSFGQTAQVDGNGGIDNSFGENIYEGILLSVDSSASTTVLTDIAAGEFTLMFDITGLDTTATQTATGITAQGFAGGKFPGTPTWTTADNWPILGGAGLLMNTTPPYMSDITFPNAYVVNGTWVSGTPTTISLSLEFSGVSLMLAINQAVVTFDHTMPNHGANGVISGVINTADLVTAIKSVAGHIAPSLCMGTTLMPILEEIEEASDIMTDGTNPGPSSTCDAISIGLGFQADVIGQPMEIAPASCAKADPCSDAAVPACDSGAPPKEGGGG